jgi:hypothetical protein
MKCSDYHHQWQERLDEGAPSARPGSDEHLAECAECRSLQAAAGRLEEGLRLLRPPLPPLGLAARTTATVLAERRGRLRRRWYGCAVAASVMLVAWAAYRGLGPFGPVPPETPVVRQEPPPNPPLALPSLNENVEEVSSALVGILNQTADKALEPGRVLLPGRVSVPVLSGSAWHPALEAPAPFFEDARQSVAHFGPVASLGRFVNYFTQEIPTPESPPKQGL